MEQEPRTTSRRLADVVLADFPESSEILVSFPDRWEYLETIQGARHPLYVAGFPIERAYISREHFAGLPPEVNVSLVFYRLYKFFRPWQTPTVLVDWDERAKSGRVAGLGDMKLQLHPVGQAQAWFGATNALIWECYFDESQRRGNWQEELTAAWKAVENDVAREKLWTAPHEPTFPVGYKEYLTILGYAQDAQSPLWWSKTSP